MQLKLPSNLNEAIIAISELQTAVSWLEGQLNLLQSFVLSSQGNVEAFAKYSAEIAKPNGLNTESMKNMKSVAQTLLAEGLSQHLSPKEPRPPDSGGSRPELKIVK